MRRKIDKDGVEFQIFEDGFTVKILPTNEKILIYPNSHGKPIEVKGVDDKFINLEIESHREEDNANRRERAHTYVNFEDLEYEGEAFMDRDPMSDPEYALFIYEEEKRINEFLLTLTDVQKRRLKMRVDEPGISLREISRRENVDIKTIRECFESIESKYKRFFKIATPQNT